jgi:hypothetical protein
VAKNFSITGCCEFNRKISHHEGREEHEVKRRNIENISQLRVLRAFVVGAPVLDFCITKEPKKKGNRGVALSAYYSAKE